MVNIKKNDMTFGRKIVDKWFLDENVVFLNHGSFGATPKPVIQALCRYHEQLEKQPVSFYIDEYPFLIRSAAGKLASFLGTSEENIVFTDNATTGVNTVLRSLLPKLSADDEIITTNHIYPAVRNALDYVSTVTGAKVIEADIPYPIEDPDEIIENFRINLSRKTKLAVFDHVSSPTALVFPVKEMAELCCMNNILVLIDGAHAPGMLDFKLDEICCDWYTGNCHKWMFAPKGCAFIWSNPRQRELIHPLAISLDYLGGFTREFDWTGTKDPSAWLSITDAIAFYDSFGRDEVKKYNHDLILSARNMMCDRIEIGVPVPDSHTGSMVTMRLPGEWKATKERTMELRNEFLQRYRIEIPFFAFLNNVWFRISAQIYNDMTDYARLADALEDFIATNNFYGGI